VSSGEVNTRLGVLKGDLWGFFFFFFLRVFTRSLIKTVSTTTHQRLCVDVTSHSA
jgi:hypothetical protein